jgi:adenosylcobinamide kinase / adenosylcobinamide-phosphate guanylyltransferase
MTTMPLVSIAHRELILGGQKSGKSRRAELLARQWLAQSGEHRAVLVATALAGDEEMRQRIARHRADRAQRVPGLCTVEEPVALAQAITSHSNAHTLVVVDCLTLWLTNSLMPIEAAPQASAANQHKQTHQDSQANPYYQENTPPAPDISAQTAMLLGAISAAKGPLVLVGNEIGLGVIPLGREVRAFVDALGLLNQRVAEACTRVTLMAAGLPLMLKDKPQDLPKALPPQTNSMGYEP